MSSDEFDDDVDGPDSPVTPTEKLLKQKPKAGENSLFEELAEIAEEYSEIDTLELAIPGTHKRLYATYRPLTLDEMVRLIKRTEKGGGRVADDRKRVVYQSVDILIASNTRIRFANREGELKEVPDGMTLGPVLVSRILGTDIKKYPGGNDGARVAVFELFKQNDSQILSHAGDVQEWFRDTTARVGSDDFLGE